MSFHNSLKFLLKQKETSTQMHTPILIGLINNIGHMHISGAEPFCLPIKDH